MNESEWLTSYDMLKLIPYLGGKGTDRKFRLFVCACGRRAWEFIGGPLRQQALEVAERFAFDKLTVEPFANLSYMNLRTAGFREGGGDAALTSQANTQEDTFTTIGLRPSTAFSIFSLPLELKGLFGWRHTFGAVTPSATVAFAGGNAFTVTGAPIARDADNIDREPHAEGVDALAGRDDEADVAIETVSAEQPFPPAVRIGRELEILHQPPAGAFDPEAPSAGGVEHGREEVTGAGRHVAWSAMQEGRISETD